MTAIVVLQSDVSATEKSATDRLYGTAIGALLGWAGGVAGAPHHALRFGLAVTLAVLICHAFKLENAGRLAGLTVAIVMMAASNMPLWKVSLYRFLEVSLGILVAVAVSWLAHRFQVAFPNAIEKPPAKT